MWIRSVLQHCPFQILLGMIFLNEANSVKGLISTEMLWLRKTIPGRERTVGPLIPSVTLAALAYIICLHLHCQRTQTPRHTFSSIDIFPLFAFCVTNIAWWWHTTFWCQFLSIWSRTITENCMETGKGCTMRVGRNWPTRTPPSRVIGRGLPRRIQSAVWKCM